MQCTGPECTREAKAKGLCHSHYEQVRLGRELAPLRPQGKRPKVKAGDRFGRWVVVRESPWRYMDGKRQYDCRCDCGVHRTIVGGSLLAGLSQSCGCLNLELVAARGRASATHGHYVGDVASPTYQSWRAMRKRCYDSNNASYSRYGARGIMVCDRWRSFSAFLADMGERPSGKSIDRIDNDGNYEPGNCRWASAKEQAANRRPKLSTRSS